MNRTWCGWVSRSVGLGVVVSFGASVTAAEDGSTGSQESVERPPNLVLVLLDDMGWKDLGCYGNERIRTPRLDAFAREGVRFTDAYSAAPVCSPTRASILTGMAPARLRITNHLPDQPRFTPEDAVLKSADCRDRLSADAITLAERLKEAGYATGFFGKWHLSGGNGPQGRGDLACYPEAQGFDQNLGGCSLGGPPTFFDPYRIHNLPPRQEGEYLPDRLADEAIEWMQQAGERPFFLSMWNYAVHWPMEAPAELVAEYEGKEGPGLKDPRYAAMIEATDAALGRLFDAIDAAGQAENTLIVVTSDNGPYLGVGDVRPLREGKGFLYEGGIRVPMMARWSGRGRSGEEDATPVVSTDLYSTFLAAAGVVPEDHSSDDGESLLPLLLQGQPLQRDALFFHYPNYAFHKANRLGGAVRSGNWKLLEWFDDDSVELYDLSRDLGEKEDLAAQAPHVVQELRARLHAWREDCDAAMPERIEEEAPR